MDVISLEVKPTGRFSNGKVLGDFISEAFGCKPIVPAYLDISHNISEFATGVNFASARTGLVAPIAVEFEAVWYINHL
ncbi:hypothetical protein IFM89_025946 [Coptis chinensis]|uniref:Uncharacterized protein n=1 Tax=Coptis chinensis TaxID=261450 RepID=A0A835HMA2_9MAGN|nr:hypothetical protein IFM89_025946 [Coptis chinensis]